MSWSTSPPSPIVKPGWTTTEPVWTPSPGTQQWAVVMTLGGSHLTVEFVTDTELQALKGLGIVQAVTANRTLNLGATRMIAPSQTLTVARALGLQGKYLIDPAATITVQQALALTKVQGIDVSAAVNVARALGLGRLATIDTTQGVTVAPTVSFDRLATLTLAQTLTTDRTTAIAKVVNLGSSTATINVSATAAMGFPPTAETTTPVTASGDYIIPRWCNYLDVIVLGGGGGALQGNFGTGAGGKAGSWNGITLTRGSSIPWTQTVIACTVGSGGAKGFISASGSASSAAGISGAGGAGGAAFGAQQGGSPGNYTFNGKSYVGGAAGTSSTVQIPGSGGFGGGAFGANSADGGRGQIWVRAYQ